VAAANRNERPSDSASSSPSACTSSAKPASAVE